MRTPRKYTNEEMAELEISCWESSSEEYDGDGNGTSNGDSHGSGGGGHDVFNTNANVNALGSSAERITGYAMASSVNESSSNSHRYNYNYSSDDDEIAPVQAKSGGGDSGGRASEEEREVITELDETALSQLPQNLQYNMRDLQDERRARYFHLQRKYNVLDARGKFTAEMRALAPFELRKAPTTENKRKGDQPEKWYKNLLAKMPSVGDLWIHRRGRNVRARGISNPVPIDLDELARRVREDRECEGYDSYNNGYYHIDDDGELNQLWNEEASAMQQQQQKQHKRKKTLHLRHFHSSGHYSHSRRNKSTNNTYPDGITEFGGFYDERLNDPEFRRKVEQSCHVGHAEFYDDGEDEVPQQQQQEEEEEKNDGGPVVLDKSEIKPRLRLRVQKSMYKLGKVLKKG